jgi:hypothetical protein
MNDSIYLAGVALTGAASVFVVLTLNRPLRSILIELCGTAERAIFWVALSRIVLIALPVIFALQFPPDPAENTSAVMALAMQLKWGLIGVVTVAGVLGLMLAAFIPSKMPPPAPASAPAHAPNPTIADHFKA